MNGENIRKIILAIVLLAVLVIVYYYGIYAPKKEAYKARLDEFNRLINDACKDKTEILQKQKLFEQCLKERKEDCAEKQIEWVQECYENLSAGNEPVEYNESFGKICPLGIKFLGKAKTNLLGCKCPNGFEFDTQIIGYEQCYGASTECPIITSECVKIKK